MALWHHQHLLLLLQLLLLFFFLVRVSSVQDSDNFIFNGFKSTKSSSPNVTLGGACIITQNGALKLTNTTNSITGYAFYSSPFGIFKPNTTTSVSSFSTTFVFQIVPSAVKHGGHGFVFLMAPSEELRGTAPGPFLGALNRRNDGNESNHMVLVEFNTVINADHLAIHVNSLQIKSEMAEPAAYHINKPNNQTVPVKLEGETPIQAWIEYDGASKIVNVTIAPISVTKPTQPLMSMPLNLSAVLKDHSFVGFASATGNKLASSHYILGWSFGTNGLAAPLNLSRLPSVDQPRKPSRSKKVMVGIGIGAGSSVAAIILFAIVAGGFLYYQHRAKLKDVLEDWEVECAHRYPYKDLYKATKGFKDSEVIGSGGFGCVYKGILPKNKETVAIKKILHNSRQGIREFVAEIASLGRMRHKHLVHLHGWCKHKDDLLLVYDYMPNGSLDSHIFGDQRRSAFLNWGQRFKILKGIASALLYLHEEWEQVVVHRDVKANNVLLDANMDGRLGDFGLSRLYDHGKHPSTTHIVGTLGYMAPELSQTGKATTLCDVFSFGALLLEVACGRRPIELDTSQPVGGRNVILLDWVREWWMRGCICQAADPKLESYYVEKEMELVLYLGLVCCQKRAESRPSMRQVTRFLDGSEALPRVATLEFAYSDSDTLSSSNISSIGHGVLSSGSFHFGGR